MVLQDGGVVIDFVVLGMRIQRVLVIVVTIYILPVNLHEVFSPVSLLLMKSAHRMVHFMKDYIFL